MLQFLLTEDFVHRRPSSESQNRAESLTGVEGCWLSSVWHQGGKDVRNSEPTLKLSRWWEWGLRPEARGSRRESTRDLLRRFQLLAWSTMFSPLAQLRVKRPGPLCSLDILQRVHSRRALGDSHPTHKLCSNTGDEEKEKPLLKSFGFGNDQTGPEWQSESPGRCRFRSRHTTSTRCKDVLEGKSFELFSMRRVDRHVHSVDQECWCSLALPNHANTPPPMTTNLQLHILFHKIRFK